MHFSGNWQWVGFYHKLSWVNHELSWAINRSIGMKSLHFDDFWLISSGPVWPVWRCTKWWNGQPGAGSQGSSPGVAWRIWLRFTASWSMLEWYLVSGRDVFGSMLIQKDVLGNGTKTYQDQWLCNLEIVESSMPFFPLSWSWDGPG